MIKCTVDLEMDLCNQDLSIRFSFESFKGGTENTRYYSVVIILQTETVMSTPSMALCRAAPLLSTFPCLCCEASKTEVPRQMQMVLGDVSMSYCHI